MKKEMAKTPWRSEVSLDAKAMNEGAMAILTISRDFGSGGREIGLAVAESLGYEYVDKEKIHDEIRAAGRDWDEWGKELDEHCPTIWEKYDWSFRGYGALVQSAILHYALKTGWDYGTGGNFLVRYPPCRQDSRRYFPGSKN
jgi:hypothetical protein